jgi:hypothetical protein
LEATDALFAALFFVAGFFIGAAKVIRLFIQWYAVAFLLAKLSSF